MGQAQVARKVSRPTLATSLAPDPVIERYKQDIARDRRGRFLDQTRAATHLKLTAPVFTSRSMYSATAARSTGANSALTASRISLTVRSPSMKLTTS